MCILLSPECPRRKIVKRYAHNAFHVSGFPTAVKRAREQKPSRTWGKCWPMTDMRQEEETVTLFSFPLCTRLFWNECFHMAYPETNLVTRPYLQMNKVHFVFAILFWLPCFLPSPSLFLPWGCTQVEHELLNFASGSAGNTAWDRQR